MLVIMCFDEKFKEQRYTECTHFLSMRISKLIEHLGIKNNVICLLRFRATFHCFSDFSLKNSNYSFLKSFKIRWLEKPNNPIQLT